ncbi:hypothetical protein CK203_020660 [Vitis vinifera]|uniref:Uncharacterized protein n=1 Tax=Vitis vinifera TaxID=29760 RepID=A0A438FMC8_VITVI|nr:hypothetical protein CK203_020660 [Vitis vinifera]
MKETKAMKTPMSSSIKLDKDEKGKSSDSNMYKGMIGFKCELLPFPYLHFAVPPSSMALRQEPIASRAYDKHPTELS